MKAIVNIGLRSVELQYKVKEKELIALSNDEKDKHFKNWELFWKDLNSKYVRCKHTITFDDIDEWKSVALFDGRTIDFHYDYEEKKEFASKKEWGGYLFQGYEYKGGDIQNYDKNEVTKVIVEF